MRPASYNRAMFGCDSAARISTLARHAQREPRALRCAVRKLQCNRPLDQAIAALGEPHYAHAAVAQLAQQAIGSDLVTGLIAAGVGSIGIASVGVELRKGVEESAVFASDRRATAGHAGGASRLRAPAQRASQSIRPLRRRSIEGRSPATGSARPRCVASISSFDMNGTRYVRRDGMH